MPKKLDAERFHKLAMYVLERWTLEEGFTAVRDAQVCGYSRQHISQILKDISGIYVDKLPPEYGGGYHFEADFVPPEIFINVLTVNDFNRLSVLADEHISILLDYVKEGRFIPRPLRKECQ